MAKMEKGKENKVWECLNDFFKQGCLLSKHMVDKVRNFDTQTRQHDSSVSLLSTKRISQSINHNIQIHF